MLTSNIKSPTDNIAVHSKHEYMPNTMAACCSVCANDGVYLVVGPPAITLIESNIWNRGFGNNNHDYFGQLSH